MKIGQIHISSGIIFAFFPVLAYLLYKTDSPALLLFLFILLPVILKIVSFPYQPGVIIFVFLFTWIQITFTIFAAVIGNLSVNELSWSLLGETAMYYSGIGLIFLGLGYQYWLKKIKYSPIEYLKKEAYLFDFKKVLILYGTFFFINLTLKPILFIIPSLTQILVRIAELKIIFLYLLIYISLLTKTKYTWVISILLIEFILGFTGYFSGFKDIIFYLFIATIPLISKVKFQQIAIGGISLFLVFTLAINWQAVKGNYRQYLNQGSRTQTIQVSKLDALSKVQELLFSVDQRARDEALFHLFDRIAYTKFIANTMDYVPLNRPHELGALWLKNFSFAAVPRFLNPNKGDKDDSQKLIDYTGIRVATKSEGSSISIGYFGECYIDFGYVGMMPMIAFIGFLIGGLFYLFYEKTKLPVLLKHGFVNVVFFGFHNFGNDGIVVAGMLTINLVYYSILYFVVLIPAARYVLKKRVTSTSSAYTQNIPNFQI